MIEMLTSHNILPKRYFYPSLNKLGNIFSNEKCPVSESISERILCLPSHNNVSTEDAVYISDLICTYN